MYVGGLMGYNPVQGALDGAANAQKQSDLLLSKLDPFANAKSAVGKIPFYSSGARSLIRIGGKSVAVCQDFQWQVSYVATPINTIDSPFPWDIDVGQAAIQASLHNIIDPTRGPEADGLFSVMASAVHQPMVEMQVVDTLGTCLFFTRGMFIAVTGNVAIGQIGKISAQFVGVAYQHYVAQNFTPYNSLAGGLSGAIGKLKNLVSGVTGGII